MARRLPLRQMRTFFLPLLVVSNVVVFLFWQMGLKSQFFMANHFVTKWTALEDGRFWTLLTAVFSHNLFLHLLVNMLVLLSFGSILERVMGSLRFIRFYLIAGVISSITHSAVSNFLMNTPDRGAVGASGSIAGLVLLFSLMFPKQKLLVFGIIPIPALWGALAFIAIDLWGLIEQTQGGGLPIGHGAHLGGAFTGIFYFLWKGRQLR